MASGVHSNLLWGGGIKQITNTKTFPLNPTHFSCFFLTIYSLLLHYNKLVFKNIKTALLPNKTLLSISI